MTKQIWFFTDQILFYADQILHFTDQKVAAEYYKRRYFVSSYNKEKILTHIDSQGAAKFEQKIFKVFEQSRGQRISKKYPVFCFQMIFENLSF